MAGVDLSGYREKKVESKRDAPPVLTPNPQNPKPFLPKILLLSKPFHLSKQIQKSFPKSTIESIEIDELIWFSLKSHRSSIDHRLRRRITESCEHANLVTGILLVSGSSPARSCSRGRSTLDQNMGSVSKCPGRSRSRNLVAVHIQGHGVQSRVHADDANIDSNHDSV
ncbi:uncharacterized protein LOC127787504 [Diospyros lotus]|uniref:uncharacterized protein LOC127787504 n=1 Tax=Diospyros lotus TaxID=55363 RepID=UPI002256A64D|nr:uncharacterized protein LOC127787504 [Diospyros lotus]